MSRTDKQEARDTLELLDQLGELQAEMHEPALTQGIVEMCGERAGHAKVRRVTLEIGQLVAR